LSSVTGIMATPAWEVDARSDRKAVRQSAAQCSARSSAGATAGTRNRPIRTRIEPAHSKKLIGEALAVIPADDRPARTLPPDHPSTDARCGLCSSVIKLSVEKEAASTRAGSAARTFAGVVPADRHRQGGGCGRMGVWPATRHLRLSPIWQPQHGLPFLLACGWLAGEDLTAHNEHGRGGGHIMTTRRESRAGGAAARAATQLVPPAFAQWRPSERYPDPAVEILDPSFAKYRLPLASVERLATGMRWSEGPAWFGAGRYLVWSDIPNNRIMRWQEENGAVSVFRQPSNNANGNTRDRQGRLVTCEHDTRRLTRTEFDGTITTLIDKFDGKPLNSPNDVVVKSDDSIWFTDPPFGILGN